MQQRRLLFRILVWGIVLLFVTACSSKKKLVTDASSRRNQPQPRGSVKARYAAAMGVTEREIKNEKLYKFIDDWMGVPYRDRGSDKDGVDCSGFTAVLLSQIYDLSVPRIARQMAESVKRKYEDELKEGDLVFFDFNGQKFSHVGIYLQHNKFVHASTTKGVIISDLKDPWYYKYFSRAGTPKGE